MGGKDSDIEGHMPKAVSRDGGRTWLISKTPFPALGVNQRPCLLRLQSGKLLFTGDFQKRGGIAPKDVAERGCYVAWSNDEGESWHIKKLPGAQPHERFPTNDATLGYSVARQAPNGVIHLITSMNHPCLHFEFNEAWLLSDAPTINSDSELMHSKATRIARVKKFTEKFPDGKIKNRWSGGRADDGRFLLHGTEKHFYQNGHVHYETTYELGRKTGSETFWRNDGTIGWLWEHNPDGTSVWTQFWENGRAKSESRWRNFKAQGKASCWDPEGKLISEVNFGDGKL